MDDKDLIEGCLRNDRRCQKELYDRFSPALFAVCRRYSGSESDAEDMLAEGFVNIFASLHTVRDRKRLFFWMKSVVVKTAIDYYRRNRKHYDNLPIDENLIVPQEVDETKIYSRLDAAALTRIISGMPDEWRTIFNLRIFEDLGFKEIAEELGKNENTVRVYFLRGKNWLVEQLKDE
ncbi:MAG: sigma-70 family RNA polymerase sigma factor [Bacteroidales bacterium]|nr:sigma-70 family RNA polymerase sigma factor [Bacteroidales bacterium]MDY6348424.1 sigma-70 family RNA polymerase sigma factor [Bacteroidales bacterium]